MFLNDFEFALIRNYKSKCFNKHLIMWSKNPITSKRSKNSLIYKEHLLKEIDYYDKRIEDFNAKENKAIYFDDDYSSESDTEFSLKLDAKSIKQLKHEETQLKTRFQATEELAGLVFSQSEVNLMVQNPEFEGEAPIKEEGIWWEIVADCTVDLIPFAISFYAHEPNRKFGPISYRGLSIKPVKKTHELELEKSVLPAMKCPSNAVEVLKSYAEAYRSRRTTLARLAEKYGAALSMEPLPTGGYLLKCVNLLEMTWVLQNKSSPIAPFHHRMVFDLEYMDESYIKIISQAHKQLSNPLISTNERTTLLSKIIATCLEAQGPTQELYESMESDQETAQKLLKRRTTLDEEPEEPAMKKSKDKYKMQDKGEMNDRNKNNNAMENNKIADKNNIEGNKKENEVMAPPKSLPKRKKPKDIENKTDNPKSDYKILKRSNTGEPVNPKKTKTIDKIDNTSKVLKETAAKSQNSVPAKNNNNNIIQNINKTSEDKPKKVFDKAKNVAIDKNRAFKPVNTKATQKLKTVERDNLKQTIISNKKENPNPNKDKKSKNNAESKTVETIKENEHNEAIVKATAEKNKIAKNKHNFIERTGNKDKITEKNKSVVSKNNQDNITQPKKVISSKDLSKINKSSLIKHSTKNLNNVKVIKSNNENNTKIPINVQIKPNTGNTKTSTNMIFFKSSNIGNKISKLPQKKPLTEEDRRHSPRISTK